MLVNFARGRVSSQRVFAVNVSSPLELLGVLKAQGVDTLICGGISPGLRESLRAELIQIVDNVACSAEAIQPALESGELQPGFGLSRPARGPSEQRSVLESLDCCRCRDRVCLRGENCHQGASGVTDGGSAVVRRMLEAAADIALEGERQLCRLSELVYFCLEMRYERVGIAFCIDLLEPAEILADVLRRFFEVVPVCCKVGGAELSHPGAGRSAVQPDGGLACNPLEQARVLNLRETRLNVIVGLCVGADSVFASASEAPVTTLFVKDKSLANNPIGALYSEYYLRESLSHASRLDRSEVRRQGSWRAVEASQTDTWAGRVRKEPS
jgi:uncharacterized metal-binding protein